MKKKFRFERPPWEITVYLRDDGEPVGLDLRTDQPITSRRLRTVPWGKAIEAARAELEPPPPAITRSIRNQIAKSKYDKAFFVQVAEVYEAARRRGEAPRQAVAKWAGVELERAAGWIKRCRDKELLGG